MYIMRPEYLVILVGFSVISIAMNTKSTPKKVFVIIVGIMLFLALNIYINIESILNKTNIYTEYLLKNTGFSNRIFSMPIFPFGFIARIVYGLLYPLPHLIFINSFNFIDIISGWRAAGTIFFFYLIPYFVKGIFRKNIHNLFGLCVLVVVCLSTFTFRHFINFYPFAIAGAITVRNNTIAKERHNYFMLTTGVLVLYFVLSFIIL